LISELIFTSGTEATPKAIMHTEQTANFSVRVAYSDMGITNDDVVWMPSPVGHSTGFNYGLRFALYHGLPLVLQDQWDGAAAVELVLRERCSYTLAATTFLQDLAETARRSGVRLDSLRCFGCGGAPVPPPLVEAAAEQGIQCLRLYGSTEVLVGTWNRPHSTLDQRRYTDGVAMTHVEVMVVDDDGAPVAANTPGEIVTRGPNTSVGLFADEARTAATVSTRWFRQVRRHRNHRRRRLSHHGQSQEGDHHPRWSQHRTARDRRTTRGHARNRARRGDRVARRATR
jgi:acyl-coenzyme A synthetase/AMP-(fatty) acid ligase